jgi:hypothetical protein
MSAEEPVGNATFAETDVEEHEIESNWEHQRVRFDLCSTEQQPRRITDTRDIYSRVRRFDGCQCCLLDSQVR